MSGLRDIERLLPSLTPAEKAQLLQWVARELGEAFPGVGSIPGICGREPCIVRTRIPIWVRVRAKLLAASEADLLKAYPTLRAEDLANAWAYYRAHRREIDEEIVENEAAYLRRPRW